MVDVVLALEGGDVGAAQGAAALVAQQAKATEVVDLAERILTAAVLVLGGKEFGRHDLAAVLERGVSTREGQ